jgi:protein TonB
MSMHVTFDQLDFSPGESRYVRTPPPAAPPIMPPPAIEPDAEWQPCGGYGTRRPRPTTIAAIVLLHAGVLTALVKLDVIPVHKAAPAPLVVTLMPEQIAPPPPPPPPATPPAPQPKQEIAPVAPAPAEIVRPAPVVVVPTATPVQVATVVAPVPQAVVATPAPTAPPAPPAPVTPPDAFAGSLSNPAPRYPVESRRRREEGTVRLRVVVTADGRVKDIAVARSSGFDRLDEAALDTVRKWRFRPGMQAGVAVEALGFLSIPFKLQG